MTTASSALIATGVSTLLLSCSCAFCATERATTPYFDCTVWADYEPHSRPIVPDVDAGYELRPILEH